MTHQVHYSEEKLPKVNISWYKVCHLWHTFFYSYRSGKNVTPILRICVIIYIIIFRFEKKDVNQFKQKIKRIERINENITYNHNYDGNWCSHFDCFGISGIKK